MGGTQVNQFSLSSPPTSPVRRKPVITYHSPSKELSSTRPYILRTSQRQKRSASHSPKSATPTSPTPVSKSLPSPNGTPTPKSLKRRSKFRVPSWQDRLPLYHPLGRFAASLPPFDPTTAGLPIPPGKEDEIIALRLPPESGLEEGNIAPSTVAQAETDGKGGPGTQKRRSGGGGSTKRKRKDPDEDSAYPARRARGAGRAQPNQVGDDDDVETRMTVRDVSEEPVERRLTRSRGPIKRADSALSDAPSTSSQVEKDGSFEVKNENDDRPEGTEPGVLNEEPTIAPV